MRIWRVLTKKIGATRSTAIRTTLAYSSAIAVSCAPFAYTAPAFAAPSLQAAGANQSLCGPGGPGTATCHIDVAPLVSATSAATPATGALGPTDIQSAYGLSTIATAPTEKTVAVVDAYDDPTAEADLGVYRSQYKLPACTTANGCFRKINQRGSTTGLPAKSPGWGLEISLDLDSVSATCPGCHILLVEADTASIAALGTGVNEAASYSWTAPSLSTKKTTTYKATAITNSYGAGEWNGEAAYETYYHHPGVAVVASSGDSGYGVSFPAASQYVVAVGGTTLTRSTKVARGWTETAWAGSGSGCSVYITKPAWQKDAGCKKRTVADISANADPASGMSTYDSTPYGTYKGWLKIGGTSASSPIVAAVFALGSLPLPDSAASVLYSHTTSLYDITSGTNGKCATATAYLCTAVTGYDGPSGLGSPNGVAAF